MAYSYVNYSQLTLHEEQNELEAELDENVIEKLNSERLLLKHLHATEDIPTEEEEGSFTVEDAVEYLGLGWFQARIFFTCTLFTVTDALEMMMLSVLIPSIQCEWKLPEFQLALFTTVVFFGMFCGSSFWGSLSDRHGRKPILFIAACWIGYNGFITSFSSSYRWLLLLRMLVGFGFGGAVQSFTLLAEYLPLRSRAKLLVVYQATWAIGTVVEVSMAAVIIPWLGWRYLVAASALPMLITIFLMHLLPESSRFLVAAGRRAEAMQIISKACVANKRPMIQGQLVGSKSESRGTMRGLVSKKYLRTSVTLWCCWFGTAFLYYGLILLSSQLPVLQRDACGHSLISASPDSCGCHEHTSREYRMMTMSSLGELLSIPFNLFFLDFVGRRKTMFINFCLTGTFLVLLQVCISNWLMTILLLFARCFSSSLFNVVYIYTTEVYQTDVRGVGLGFGSSMSRVGAMITPFVAQVLLETHFHVAVSVYGSIGILCGLLALLLPYETMGLPLGQGISQ